MCLKLYQCEVMIWWCFFVMKSYMESALQYVLKYVMVKKG